MKKTLTIILTSIMIFLCACSTNNTNVLNNNQENGIDTEVSYSLEYDTFIEKISQCIGPEEMFLSIEKSSTLNSYDSNFTDLYTLVSMFQREYNMEIIYNKNTIVSIVIRGQRVKLNDEEYSLNTDYVILASVIYQILNQQTDAYPIMVDTFNMNSGNSSIMETETTENWIILYSANKENITFHCQLKTK